LSQINNLDHTHAGLLRLRFGDYGGDNRGGNERPFTQKYGWGNRTRKLDYDCPARHHDVLTLLVQRVNVYIYVPPMARGRVGGARAPSACHVMLTLALNAGNVILLTAAAALQEALDKTVIE
jgi:hypothetical protein